MKNISLYDVHTHTNVEPLINELNNIVDVCKQKKIIGNCVGTNLNDSTIAIQQAKQYPGQIYATIGIHPENCKDIDDISKLEQLYLENKDVIVAGGEIGLDYHYENFDKEKQILFFKKQLDIVNKYNLPVCIHVRDAEEDCFNILKIIKNQNKIGIHCFSKNKHGAEKYINAGYMVSIPGIVTFKNATSLHEALKVIPLNNMLVETDGPGLTPVPYRGKINYPQNVELIIDKISSILKINKNELIKKITANAVKFFEIK